MIGRIASALVLGVLLAGCEQTVKRNLPSSIQTLVVREFKNQTNEDMLPAYLFEELRRAFRLDGRLTVLDAGEGADGLLDGAIIEYVKQPARFDENNVIQEYRLRMVADLSLTDMTQRKVLWVEKGPKDTATWGGTVRKLERFVNFVVVPAAGLSVETEQDAQRRMLREFAGDVVLKVIEGW